MNPGVGAAQRASWAKTPHDALRLPDGRKVGDVHRIEPILVALGIPGTSHEWGRAQNVEAYAAHLGGIHARAGAAAVAQWLRSHHGGAVDPEDTPIWDGRRLRDVPTAELAELMQSAFAQIDTPATSDRAQNVAAYVDALHRLRERFGLGSIEGAAVLLAWVGADETISRAAAQAAGRE